MQQQDTLREKYKLAPRNAAMERVKKLLQNARNISLEQISTIIASDEELCRRAYAIAFPSNPNCNATQDDASAAVDRVGLNILVILTLGNILNNTVIKTFETMAGISLKPANPLNCLKSEDEYLTGCVSFHGKANGRIYMVFDDALSNEVYGGVYGNNNPTDEEQHLVRDTVGELVNIITGSLQSNLCDAGLDCRLVVPAVSRMEMEKMEKPPGHQHEVFVFLTNGKTCWVHLMVNPNKF